jgi:hypothetical protein
VTLKSLALAAVGGIVAFLLVGAVVTQVGTAYTEFSVFLGIPAGLVAAVVTVVTVLLGYGQDPSALRRRAATAVGAFGLLFVLSFVVAIGAIGVPVVTAMLGSVVIGVVVAVAVFVRSAATVKRVSA